MQFVFEAVRSVHIIYKSKAEDAYKLKILTGMEDTLLDMFFNVGCGHT